MSAEFDETTVSIVVDIGDGQYVSFFQLLFRLLYFGKKQQSKMDHCALQADGGCLIQVNNYEIVVNFFHISHNLT